MEKIKCFIPVKQIDLNFIPVTPDLNFIENFEFFKLLKFNYTFYVDTVRLQGVLFYERSLLYLQYKVFQRLREETSRLQGVRFY